VFTLTTSRKIIWFSLFLFTLGISSSAGAASSPPREGVKKAADLQLSRQGTYPNGSTGVGVYTCAWQWDINPTSPAYRNTQGPSALGLLAAYEALGKVKYLNGVVCAANQMILRYDADTGRAYAQDMELLVRLSEATQNPVYRNRARLYHQRTRAAFQTGADPMKFVMR